MASEKKIIEGVAAKQKKKGEYRLLNWPPSRGPQPKWMTAKPKYTVPPVEIEMVEWVRGRSCDGKIRDGARPATEIVRVPTPKAPKSKRKKRPGVIYMADLHAEFNAKSEMSLSVFAHVDQIVSLRPEQWNLVGGAVTRPPSSYKIRSGRTGKIRTRHVQAHASLEIYLPIRALVFDISYPLSKIARITIKPYKRKIGRGSTREDMSVGYVLWQLAQAYKQIYRQHKKWGVWGHAIGDLVFEQLKVSDNIGYVAVGS